MPTEYKDSEVYLALTTLGNFDFSGHILNEFVKEVTTKYAAHENPEIRLATALTCSQLFSRDPILNQKGKQVSRGCWRSC